MPGVVRQGDNCSGHFCWPPRPPSSYTSKTYVNGRLVVRIGDGWTVHCCDEQCHPGVQAGGSAGVYFEGSRVARQGDAISCGSVCAQHSDDVIVNT